MKIFKTMGGVFRNYFSEVDSPFNLAIFRIVLFSVVLFNIDISEAEWFAGLPPVLRCFPQGLAGLVASIPLNPGFAHTLTIAFILFSFSALVGFFSRTAALGAALCSICVWGFPKFYGDVDHLQHHLVWFMLILSVSPCADVLSLDAIVKAFRQADQGRLPAQERALRYGLPFRFIWLLMGVCYFFPGFWKLMSGPQWVFSDNLKYHLYQTWFDLGGYSPFFPLDQHHWLCVLSAAGTILFEMTFVFLILFPRLRLAAAAGGLFFHVMTGLFMSISFWSLRFCYVSFLDWDRFFAWAGRKLFPRPLYLLYDGNCKICRRTIFSFRQFDVFKRVLYINALNGVESLPPESPKMDPMDLMRDMHVVVGNQKWMGYEAYRILVPRIPLFWPLWPFLWVWPIPAIGKIIYRKVADSRMCQIRTQPLVADRASSGQDAGGNLAPLKCMSSFLLVINFALGSVAQSSMWPFACYPTFRYVIKAPQLEEIAIFGVSKGRETDLDVNDALGGGSMRTKILRITESILNPHYEAQIDDRLRALYGLMETGPMDLKPYHTIRFYAVTYSTVPAMDRKVLSRRLLLEIKKPSS